MGETCPVKRWYVVKRYFIVGSGAGVTKYWNTSRVLACHALEATGGAGYYGVARVEVTVEATGERVQ